MGRLPDIDADMYYQRREMVKVENDMLVLNSIFSKEDVQAINEFVKINVDKERQRILDALEAQKTRSGLGFVQYDTLYKIFGE